MRYKVHLGVLLISFWGLGLPLQAQEKTPPEAARVRNTPGATDGNQESEDGGIRPFAVMTVGQDGSIQVRPYIEGESVPTKHDDHPEERSLQRIDPVEEPPPDATQWANDVRSFDPALQAELLTEGPVLRSVDPQRLLDETLLDGLQQLLRSADPMTEPFASADGAVLRSVDPIVEPGSLRAPKTDGGGETEGMVESPMELGPKTHDIDFVINAISSSCNADGTLYVSGIVQNIGTSLSGSFDVGIYASTNSIISTSDTLLGYSTFSNGLSGGATGSFSGDVTASISAGTYYVGAYADDTFVVTETNESNNTRAGDVESLPCAVGSADLVITSMSDSCNADGTLAVSGSVQNVGSASAGAFEVGIYASTNSTISTSDTRLGFASYPSLSAGGTGTFSGDLTVSSITPGTYYIGAYADDQFQVNESDDGNNTRVGSLASLPCVVASVDLRILSISGSCNSDGTLAVAGQVRNDGTVTSGAFEVGIYASTNSTISTSDTRIGLANYSSGLSSGGTSTFSGNLSASITAGTYYLGAYADDQFQVSESNENNNTLAGNQASLPCPVASVDLTIPSISGSCNSDGTLAVIGQVRNGGTVSSGVFEVGIYASTNSTISTGDTRIGVSTYSSGLSSGATSTYSGDLTVSSLTPGSYYIGAYADDQFQVSETNENNNTLAGNVASLPCSVASSDLVVTSISGICNADGTLAVSGGVQNSGSASSGAFEVGIYASTNSAISTGDTRLAYAFYDQGLSGGGAGTFSGDVSASSLSPGTYYIGAYTDDQFQVSESNESNNTLAGNQASLPCATVGDVDLKLIAISGSCNADGTLGVSGTLQSVGTNDASAFELGVYASTNSVISTTDIRIGVATYTSGLSAGTSSNFSGDLNPTSLASGTYYIGAYADDQFQVSESDEGNNNLAGAQLGWPCSNGAPDIRVSPTSLSFDSTASLSAGGGEVKVASGAFLVPRTAAAKGTGETTLHGVTYVVSGDTPDGDPRRHVFFTDERGREMELMISDTQLRELGGPQMVDRRILKVDGAWSARGFEIDRFVFDKASGVPAAKAVTGSQRWVTVLCRFSDSTNVTPHNSAWFSTLMGTANPGMDHYWRELSYNSINLTGSVVHGWYDLPDPRASYLDAANKPLFSKLANDCTGAANADADFSTFDGVNLMFNSTIGCCAWGGGANVTTDGAGVMDATWMPPWGYENQDVLGQEMGHGFGLMHSSGPYTATYDSAWDVMSEGGMCNTRHAEYGCIGVHTIAYHKDFLGWVPASRKYLASAGSNQTITLERLALPPNVSGTYLMAQIPINGSSTHFYTVEARRSAGYDNGEIPGQAVVIHEVDKSRGDRLAQVVDEDGDGDPDDAGAMWTVGETFTDAANEVTVEVVAQTASGFQVRVQLGSVAEEGKVFTVYNDGTAPLNVTSITPETSAPWLLVNPTSFTVSAGASVDVTVNVDYLQAPSGISNVRLLVASDDADENPYPNGVFVSINPAAFGGMIFFDGFESGTMSSWSSSVP